MSIPDLPTEEPLTITPTIDGQEISALDDLKYNPITVEPVTSAIDSNIQPENIKEGVTILGVAVLFLEDRVCLWYQMGLNLQIQHLQKSLQI